MKTDYCAYPPRIAVDVEIGEQRDGDRPAFTVGSASVGRYLLLRTAEYRTLQLLGEELRPAAICMEFGQRYGGTLTLTALTKFLTRLDETGILAGERREGHYPLEQQLSTQFYTRFSLFNPDPHFARLVSVMRWVWTTPFFAGSLLLMLTVAAMALMNGSEVAHYGSYILREHYVAVIVAGLLVGVTHEFAHGLTCKAFGGRATEVGVLLIYYFLPALYCNVWGIHLIPPPEREIGDLRVGHPVRLKVRSYPDLVFRGRVAKIGSEGETDQNNQVVYRVEMVIENTDDLLRPGMTAFARIDFGQWIIGRILLHKIRQALRPEMWMI